MYRKKLLVLTVFLVFMLAGLSSCDSQIEEDNKNEDKSKQYDAGMLEVGRDIPEGEYILFPKDNMRGEFQVWMDNTGDFNSMLGTSMIDTNSIVSVYEGQYLELKRSYAIDIDGDYDIDTTGEGMFKVGVHIPAGEYIIKADSIESYCWVLPESTHDISYYISETYDYGVYLGENIINGLGDEITTSAVDGQYLLLIQCHIEKISTK